MNPEEQPTESDSVNVARTFVKELAIINAKLDSAKKDLKREKEACDEMDALEAEGKDLRARKKELLLTHPVLSEYNAVLEEVKEERKNLISDAKSDGLQKKEVDMAIMMLKKDIDPSVTTEMFRTLADLVH